MAITTVGMAELVDLWGGISTPVIFGYIAFGTGTGAAGVGNTTLGTEIDRAAATVSQISILGPLDTIRFANVFDLVTGRDISEVGVFNGDTTGDLLGRMVLSPVVTIPANGRAVVIYDYTFKDGGFSGGSGC